MEDFICFASLVGVYYTDEFIHVSDLDKVMAVICGKIT